MHVSWFWPALDCGYLCWVHVETCGDQDEAQVFHCIWMELAFLGISIEASLLKLPKYSCM